MREVRAPPNGEMKSTKKQKSNVPFTDDELSLLGPKMCHLCPKSALSRIYEILTRQWLLVFCYSQLPSTIGLSNIILGSYLDV